VTGAGGGIGREIAFGDGAFGRQVLINDVGGVIAGEGRR